MQHTSNLLIGRPACHSIRRAGLVVLVGRDVRRRMPDWLWERDEPLLPEPPFHPSGCQRPRAMDAILLIVLVPCRGAVERAGCDQDLLFELGTSALSGVGA